MFSLSIGFTKKGSLWIAQTSDRLHTLKRQYAIIKSLGIQCEIFSIDKIKEKLSIIDPHEIWVKIKQEFLVEARLCVRVVSGWKMISWLIPSRLL